MIFLESLLVKVDRILEISPGIKNRITSEKLKIGKTEQVFSETKISETKISETKISETKISETKINETKINETKIFEKS